MTYFITAIIGLCVGSFMHVVIARFDPDVSCKKYLASIIFSRSHCCACGSKLKFYELIPLFSWIYQKKRCNYCIAPISFNYLLAEILVSFYFLLIIIIFDVSPNCIMLIIIGLLSIIISAIDARYYVIPNIFSYLLLILGMFTSLFNIGLVSLSQIYINVIFGFLLLFLPSKLYCLLKNKKGLGEGDIFLVSIFGLFIPYYLLPYVIVIASLLGLIYCLFLKLRHKKSLNKMIIPFAPFILIAANIILNVCSFLALKFNLVF